MIPLPAICELPRLAESLRSGHFPLLEYLARLEGLFEANEPEVQAFVPEDRRFERVRSEAAQLLAQYPDPRVRPPLFGVPLAIKDIFHVAGLPTRAGSQLPPEELAGPEAGCVAALKRAGALALGKTETAEFAYRAPPRTRNPFDPEHTPGGSSSGSAAAVCAGLAPIALGSQTIGSTNRPAAYCGIAGCKPSYGRLPVAGMIPLAPSLDHPGLLAPTAADLAFLFGVLTGPGEPVFRARTPVLGIPVGPYLARMETSMAAHFDEVLARLESVGIRLVSNPAFSDLESLAAATWDLLAAEAAVVHRRWYAQFPNRYRQQTVDLFARGRTVPAARLERARALRLSLRTRCLAERARYGFDFWLTPSATGRAPLGLADTGEDIMQLPWSLSGLPSVNFRSGEIGGLPVGVQLVGGWYADADVLSVAAHLEGLLAER